MTRNFLAVLLTLLAVSCGKGSDKVVPHPTPTSASAPTPTSGAGTDCGYHNEKRLYLGPQGGCFYYNSNGNKTYVARSECKC
ncbi:hypothetical protein KTO58_12570 [Chitinophaga pendula]|uniref:hypothetical protein n=1 Tax=Chitinophaga TaxID=79328 RepID=UPI0012FD61FB|nr:MULTISPECIES: hypothetical protein [Chitinophaga]UCJ09991.1 hypothetical protein KTO58_12570 [Chitinophaga pendula]